jgi:hypothetical protein
MNNPLRLYNRLRLAGYTTRELGALFAMAYHDTQCENSVYAGMDRTETVVTAWASCADIANDVIARSLRGDDEAEALRLRLADEISAIPAG